VSGFAEGHVVCGGVRVRYVAGGAGEPLLWLNGLRVTPTHELVAAQRRVIVLDLAEPAAIAAAAAALGIDKYDVLGNGRGAEPALRLALDHGGGVRALVLLAPTVLATADAALVGRLSGLAVPSLALFGTRDASAPPETARHYRERIPGCNLMFVYDAGAAMAEERPEAVAAVVLDFLDRHDLFLVRRQSDLIHP
jgi:pimeloyl-ACP methyl ester carboxylesterase